MEQKEKTKKIRKGLNIAKDILNLTRNIYFR